MVNYSQVLAFSLAIILRFLAYCLSTSSETIVMKIVNNAEIRVEYSKDFQTQKLLSVFLTMSGSTYRIIPKMNAVDTMNNITAE